MLKKQLKDLCTPVTIIILVCACHRDSPTIDEHPPNSITEFQKSYGGSKDDVGNAVIEAANGDFICLGTTESNSDGKDIYIFRTDKNGNLIWSKTFGGDANDEGKEICATTDGNYIVLGNTASKGAGKYDIYLLKIDNNGNKIWESNFGGTADETGEDIVQTAENNYLITGATRSFGNGERDIYVIKTDDNGKLIWDKTFGDKQNDAGMSLCNADSGNVMLFNFTENYGAINRDWYVIKINDKGDSLTSALFGGNEYEEAQSIERTTTGNFLLFGHSASFGDILHDMYAAEITPDIKLVWQKNYGGARHDGGEHAKQTSEGGYILVGQSMSFSNYSEQMYVVKTDRLGNKLYERDIGFVSNDGAYNMAETGNAYVFIGYTKGNNRMDNDVFLVKIAK